MSTRERILDAAAEILRERGVVRATTKEIAKAAGLSEAALYKHFGDKEELLLHVLKERLPGVARLDLRPGEGDIEANLAKMARAALDFYRESWPMMGPLTADPQRLATHRESMSRHGAGPEQAVAVFAAYLRAERDLGRIAADADPEAAASLLIGACFQQAFLRYYAEGPQAPAAPRSTARALARTLARALV